MEIDDREEGEIIEDELEDISDCSMSSVSLLHSGKSVSSPQILRCISLSSDSDKAEVLSKDTKGTSKETKSRKRSSIPRKKFRRKRPAPTLRKRRYSKCHHARRKRITHEHSSDSESEKLDSQYMRHLKDAVRRETSQEMLHNSLRTRLKAMIEPGTTNSYSDDDPETLTLRDLALLSTIPSAKSEVESEGGKRALEEPNDKSNTHEPPEIADNLKESGNSSDCLDDSELIELRLAALKSAVLKKHHNRKKRKIDQNHNSSTDSIILADGTNESGNTSIEINEIDKENKRDIINEDLYPKNKMFKLVDSKSVENAKSFVNILNDNVSCVPDNNVGLEAETNKTLVQCSELEPNNAVVEEDVDVLRAILLASMSKKLSDTITKNNEVVQPKSVTTVLPEYRVINSNPIYSSLSVTVTKPIIRTISNPPNLTPINPNLVPKFGNKLIIKPNKSSYSYKKINTIQPPSVKPLIINLNADSDSEVEKNDNSLKQSVSKFLKQQRAEVEAHLKKQENAQRKTDDFNMDKSVMKLLPRSQQIEYRKLKQQLLMASKQKIRIRRKMLDGKREVKLQVNNVVNKKVLKPKAEVARNVMLTSAEKEVMALKSALDDLQTYKNGRLQMKGKYQALGTILQQINQASDERRQTELEIKRLLNELQSVRNKLANSHEKFTSLVKQLVTEKEAIDQCMHKSKIMNGIETPNCSLQACLTSTPKKKDDIKNTMDMHALVERNSEQSKTNYCNTNSSTNSNDDTIIADSEELLKHDNKIVNHKKDYADVRKDSITNSVVKPQISVQQDKTKCVQSFDNVIEEHVPPNQDLNYVTNLIDTEQSKMYLDPNDITIVFSQQKAAIDDMNFPKYVSPLDHHNGYGGDPSQQICPFDLLGVCKDKECLFKHWSSQD